MTIPANERFYRPKTAVQITAHERFVALNKLVTLLNGWITSPPGEKVIRIECLPGSKLPDELAELGYRVTPIGEGQRLIPDGVIERFMIGDVEQVRRHAGIVAVERYEAIGS